ncbi:hypothetical protein ACFQNF_19880 [Iodobacter arcticus]|uniref:Uncharacterized protein n=1 Tax=Iodobacter arcticus TaxID=590593 RepID=A0ABW2R2V2_9NEIS
MDEQLATKGLAMLSGPAIFELECWCETWQDRCQFGRRFLSAKAKVSMLRLEN